MKNTLLAVLAVLMTAFVPHAALAQDSPAPPARQIEIPADRLTYRAAQQGSSHGCWAASVQMVLNSYGIEVSQQQVMERIYGAEPEEKLPNWVGNFEAITAKLNHWKLDNNGRPCTVMATLDWRAPSAAVLIRELSQGRPLIAAYSTEPLSAHAVVITATSYTPSSQGPVIQSVGALDPRPSEQNVQAGGRVEYPGAEFDSLIQAYWYISVE